MEKQLENSSPIQTEVMVETEEATQIESVNDSMQLDVVEKEVSTEVQDLTQSSINQGLERASRFTEDETSVEDMKVVNERIEKLKDEQLDRITWIRERFNLAKMERENHDGFEIQGTPEFREKIKEAIGFLALDPERYRFSQEYVGRIQEWERSGMNMFKDKPTFEVGDIWKQFDTFNMAAAIAHEAYHSFLCRDSKDQDGKISIKAFIGKEAEKKCIAFQIDTLRTIRDSGKITDPAQLEAINENLDYLSSIVDNPTHQDIPYEDRNW